MRELSDLEICKRIAEIELGKSWFCNGDVDIVYTSKTNMNAIFGKKHGDNDGNTAFNPLADDALCFRLMVKYEVSLGYGAIERYYASPSVLMGVKEYLGISSATNSKSPNRAICLAIIASKEQS